MFHPLIRLPSTSARLSPRAFGGERMRLRLPSLDFGVSVYGVDVFFTMLALIWGWWRGCRKITVKVGIRG